MGVIWGESVEQEEKRVVEGFALLSFSSNNHGPFFTLPAMLPDSGHRKVKKKVPTLTELTLGRTKGK